MAHFWILCEGIGFEESAGREDRRNGREPFGDAWLLDEVISKSIPTNFKYAWSKADQYASDGDGYLVCGNRRHEPAI